MQARDIFDDIRNLSYDGVGVSRESYGPGENATIEYLSKLAQSEGLAVSKDVAGNVVFSLPGEVDEPSVWCGSHLDSVPQGGNFDGLAGVVAGLLCLLRLKRDEIRLRRPFKVIGFRGEESAWYGKAYVGSGALFGKLTQEDLALTNRRSGRTLREAMRSVGADVERIGAGEVLIDSSTIAGYIELHIEQGPVMVARKLPVAIVSGIRGNVRHNRIKCVGEAGHSGAVPRWLRRDAVFAVSDLLMRMDEHWRALLEHGMDLVITAGIITTNPAEHSISRIPGEVTFSFEARSQSKETLEGVYELLRAECRAVARERGVSFEFDRRLSSEPAKMSTDWCEKLREVAARMNLSLDLIPSGAGHDASLYANAGFPTAMIFIRNEHGSHNPNEAMDLADFELGVRLLYQAIQEF